MVDNSLNEAIDKLVALLEVHREQHNSMFDGLTHAIAFLKLLKMEGGNNDNR